MRIQSWCIHPHADGKSGAVSLSTKQSWCILLLLRLMKKDFPLKKGWEYNLFKFNLDLDYAEWASYWWDYLLDQCQHLWAVLIHSHLQIRKSKALGRGEGAYTSALFNHLVICTDMECWIWNQFSVSRLIFVLYWYSFRLCLPVS